MIKKKLFIVAFVFAFITMAAADTSHQVFDSWCGSHYTKIGGNIPGRVSYGVNSITYDSSWTETKSHYISGASTTSMGQTIGVPEEPRVETYTIKHERWVTFYFDQNGIITTWRSYGWKRA
ncbi:MAG: hypothetical protein LBH18_01165 [Spirochaetaceae bacterium]|nr:hypothetical protein [Spirochaetaceae bacterium]